MNATRLAVLLGALFASGPSFAQKPLPNLWKPPALLSRDVLQRQWQLYSRHVTRLEIYGTGTLWQKLTGLGNNEGLRVKDHRLALRLLQHIQFVNEKEDDAVSHFGMSDSNDKRYPIGSVTVDIYSPLSRKPHNELPLLELEYNPRNAGQSRTLGDINHEELILMRQHRQFQHWFPAFTNWLARRARTHDKRVSRYAYETT